MLDHEHRLPAGLGPLVDLGVDVGRGPPREAALLRMAGELDAAVVKASPPRDRFGDRPHDLGEPTLGEHEPSSSAWTSTLRSSA